MYGTSTIFYFSIWKDEVKNTRVFILHTLHVYLSYYYSKFFAQYTLKLYTPFSPNIFTPFFKFEKQNINSTHKNSPLKNNSIEEKYGGKNKFRKIFCRFSCLFRRWNGIWIVFFAFLLLKICNYKSLKSQLTSRFFILSTTNGRRSKISTVNGWLVQNSLDRERKKNHDILKLKKKKTIRFKIQSISTIKIQHTSWLNSHFTTFQY